MSYSLARKVVLISVFPLVICATETVSWWWRNPPIAGMEDQKVLKYSFPVDSPASQKVDPNPKAIKMLKPESFLAGWIAADNGKVNVNYIEWDQAKKGGLSHALGHAPEVCMSGVGDGVEAFLAERSIIVDSEKLVFDATQFRDEEGEPLFVYKLVWVSKMKARNMVQRKDRVWETRLERVKMAMNRQYPDHARTLMLGVFGAEDEQQAWELVEEHVLGDLSFVTIKE